MVTREAAVASLDAWLAERSFTEFLRHVWVRGDDPLHPVETRWEPWPYLLERAEAWAAGGSEVDLKSRQLGWSWLLAAYYCWRARAGWAIGHISAGQVEARVLLGRVRFVEEHLPPHLRSRATFTADEATYPRGGLVHAFPSTDHAGIGFTFQCVGMDEAAFHPFGSANYAAVEPTVSAGGQFLIGSTADPRLGPSGFLHDIYWASKRGETGYAAVFWPWHIRPGRDAAWLQRQRAAFTGLAEEFDAFYPETDAAAFVGRSGLVYGQFDVAKHVRAAHPWKWKDSTRRVAGVDFGGGDPTACVMVGLSGKKSVHQFGEFYERGPVGVAEIARFVSSWEGPGVVYCDPSEPVAIVDLGRALRGTGWTTAPADNRRGEGLGFVSWLLDEQRLTIAASCVDSIAEFPGYRWANRTDPNDKTRYATSTPVDNHADGKDALRYTVMALLDAIRGYSRPLVATVDGSPRRKWAV